MDAGRSLARQYKYSHIEELLRCSGETGQVTDKCHDDIILACVSIVAADQSQVRLFFFVTPYIFLVRTIFFNTGLFNETLSTLSSKKGKKLKDLKNHNYISKFYNNC